MKLNKIILTSSIAVFGFGLGVILNDLPLISFKPEISLTDFVSLFLTLVLTIFVASWLTQGRYRKDFLICEFKELLTLTRQIYNEVRSPNWGDLNSQKLTMSHFNLLGVRLRVLISEMENSLKIGKNNYVSELKEEHISYWDTITGSNFNSANFKPTEIYFRKVQKQQIAIETAIRKGIHFINER